MEATAKKATFQKYSAYKDSGVEWLGELPKNWDEVPLCTLTKLKSVINCSELELLSVYLDLGVIKFSEVEAKRTNVTSQDLSKYQRVDIGDFVLNNQQAWRGSVGVSNHQGIVSPAYLVLELSKKLHTGYANYMFRSGYMVGQYLINSKGVGTIQRNLYWPSLRRAKVILPPLPEQTAIAAFLDDKTAKIDRAIAQKEKMISLLKERKQIIIQNAVTKGLDPNAKMKHSGVEWIGEIPEGWEVLPGLRFFKENKRSNKGMKESTVLSLSYGNIIIKPEEKLVGLVPESFETYQIVYPGDIIIRCTDLQNDQTSLRTGLAQNKGIITSAYINLGIIGDNHPEYLHAYLHFVDITKVLYKFGSGLRQNLSFADFKRMPILKVPYNEQVQIVEFIQKASLKIERAIEMQHKEIEKLKELKSTLIDSAVTGKLRVPSVQEIKVS